MSEMLAGSALQPLDWLLLLAALWLVIGVAGLLALRRFDFVARVLFPLGGLVALAVALVAASTITAAPQSVVLAIGLPSLPFHFRLDALAAFFVMVIGVTTAGVSIFAAGYFRQGEGTPPGLLCLEYHLFVASMVLVVLADDAYAFMVMWETMALSSFFLVTANHRIPEIRRAGYLYLLIAHVGAIGILLCFGVLQANTGDYTFANMRAQELASFPASLALLLALFGFGAKAGIVPLHVWLPEAHPAAPSPVSALMSAVMLKTAVYGFLRVSLDLLHAPVWWWGVLLLAVGLLTALFGVVFAAVQTDMKRLLAYSSIENIGLMFTGIGLTLLFSAYGMQPMAALALTAVLYHVASHALFKSLLFVGTGSVLHATSERSLGKLGGLIRFMPWVGWLTLLAVLASAGLPPFGGFVSEWLLLQGFVFAPGLPGAFLSMLVPALAALVALVSALSGYTMVKFYGVIFLGRPREEKLHTATDAGIWERAGMLWLALGCIGLGLLPSQFIALIDPVTALLVNAGIGRSVAEHGWLLVPVAIERASYGPVIFLLGVAACFVLAFGLVRLFYHGRVRRAPPWDCGFAAQTARMQDTAEGFGQPIRHIFGTAFRMSRVLPSPFDRQPRYEVTVSDHVWHGLYLPLARITERIARLVGRLQQGRIAIYLLYSFITLIFTLVLVHR
ncbi:MAG: hydrogenase 4 subunit B [Betaproteobacteria bacterium HGW-Betaproteobacteria-12]|nr:MAG: hydrogenase 4 subunit B [Betaproteobacteria bacterium HGW-Betaproteobacteria-12]